MHQEIWLLGHPPMTRYLEFVEEMVVGGVGNERSQLVDEWREANQYFMQLEESEAGIADNPAICDLDPALQPLAEAVRADSRFRRSFQKLPTRFAMVELDKLMIGHPYVSLHHTERLKARLGPSPTPEALFHFCLPLDRMEAPVKVREMGSRRLMFWSASSDFRFMESAILSPEQIQGFDAFGAVGSVVGLFVGYGSNFLNVIQADNRLLLHNGHHRAYALRDLGITHAPCIVQSVKNRDELAMAAARAVLDNPALYFRDKRPPILKDFFDPKFRKVLPVQNMINVVEISFEAKLLKKIRDFGGPD
jgi:hypothetical protein